LWKDHPKGFSDAQFPNLGYTYLINLGTPFTMQIEEQKQRMRTDGFLPRYHAIESFHRPGDHLFGIKFRISPVIFEKKINFSEYKGYVYPLSYLLDPQILSGIKKTKQFDDRVNILSKYFISILDRFEDSTHPLNRRRKNLNFHLAPCNDTSRPVRG
jgi:hypothetical protein